MYVVYERESKEKRVCWWISSNFGFCDAMFLLFDKLFKWNVEKNSLFSKENLFILELFYFLVGLIAVSWILFCLEIWDALNFANRLKTSRRKSRRKVKTPIQKKSMPFFCLKLVLILLYCIEQTNEFQQMIWIVVFEGAGGECKTVNFMQSWFHDLSYTQSLIVFQDFYFFFFIHCGSSIIERMNNSFHCQKFYMFYQQLHWMYPKIMKTLKFQKYIKVVSTMNSIYSLHSFGIFACDPTFGQKVNVKVPTGFLHSKHKRNTNYLTDLTSGVNLFYLWFKHIFHGVA